MPTTRRVELVGGKCGNGWVRTRVEGGEEVLAEEVRYDSWEKG